MLCHPAGIVEGTQERWIQLVSSIHEHLVPLLIKIKRLAQKVRVGEHSAGGLFNSCCVAHVKIGETEVGTAIFELGSPPVRAPASIRGTYRLARSEGCEEQDSEGAVIRPIVHRSAGEADDHA
eukprot:7313254-Prymnesium_polylepis.2